MPLDPRASRLATAQEGVVSRPQLLTLGMSEGEVDGIVQRGLLEVAQRGVYRVPGSPETTPQNAMAAALRCAPSARIAGELALDLMGVPESRGSEQFHVLTHPGRRVRNVGFPHYTDPLPDRYRARVGRIPIVCGPLAVLEAIRDVPDDRALSIVDACRWANIAYTEDLLELADGLVRHPGAATVRRLARTGSITSESPGERGLEAALTGSGIPFEQQVWLAPDIRVDFLIRPALLVIEYAGRRHHTDPRDRARDAGRERRIRALGYAVLYVYAEDLYDREALWARVRRAMDAARPAEDRSA